MLGMASFFKSKTIRIPSRSDSSRRSEIPSSFLSLIRPAMRSIMLALLVMYGISVTMIRSRPVLLISMLVLARMMTRPLPVSKAERTP